MKRIIFFLLIFTMFILRGAVVVMTPEEVNNPKTLLVKGDKIIISEDETIYIYSESEKKLIRKFGKEGEGPGEFKMGHGSGSLNINIFGNKIYVNSSIKLSTFDLTGKFISEIRVPPMSNLIPVGNEYVSNSVSPSDNQFPVASVCIYSKDFRESKTIFKSSVPIGMGARLMIPAFNFKYLVYKNMIYISTGTENIELTVFINSGKILKKIRIPNEKRAVSHRFRQDVRKFYRTDPVYKNYWNYMKEHLYFPEFFPAVKDLFIDSENIYIQTYEKKNNNFKWIVTDMEGKIILKKWLPSSQISEIAYSPYTVSNGKFYYFKEDLEEETWILYSEEIR